MGKDRCERSDIISWMKILTFFLLISPTYGFIEGLYCGTENCYDILSVTRASTKGEITKAYRKLAKKWHPDMHKKKDDKIQAEEMFKTIANAYEVLRDEDSRKDYDYMLDNPDEYYRHYYYYYRRRVAPKVDVRLVIAVTISIISAIQYWSAWNNYNTAIQYLVTVPKYRLQAVEIAKSKGLLDSKKKKDRSKTKEEIKQEEENVLKSVIEEKMDIRGSYSKPTIKDILWIQLLFLPYNIWNYVSWYVRWVWKFMIKKEEYGEEEKLYVIQKKLGLSSGQFNSLEEADLEKYMKLELWKEENFKEWKEKQEEEQRAKLADNSRHKMYRRYMKKGGPGQMTFGPE